MQNTVTEGLEMLKISMDDVTMAIQKDIHREMETDGVCNFFDYGAEKANCSPNTFRNLMENGNWHSDHLKAIRLNTKARYLKEVFAKWSE